MLFWWMTNPAAREGRGAVFSPVSKLKAKINVCCPHCGHGQQEPGIARSTYCRGCSEYFAIGPAVLDNGNHLPRTHVPPGPRLVTPAAPLPAVVPAVEPSAPEKAGSFSTERPEPVAVPTPLTRRDLPPPTPKPASAADPEPSSFRQRFGFLLGGAPRNQVVRCFECNGAQEVSGAAQSTICKDCGAYVDLQDYKITGNFSRNIVTRGTLTLLKGGDLSSSKIVCSAATLHGRMRGNLLCAGKVTIRFRGRMPGSLEAGDLVVEKGAELEFARPLRVSTLELFGKMSAPQVDCDGHVTIYKNGALSGGVRARGFSVEKGGGFEGELTISPRAGKVSAEAVEETNPPAEPSRLWNPSAVLLDGDPLPG